MKDERPPTREELERRLLGLLSGELSREDVASWENAWISLDDPPIDDPAAWDALGALSGVDVTVPYGHSFPYLYGDSDFHAWLDGRENAMDESRARRSLASQWVVRHTGP